MKFINREDAAEQLATLLEDLKDSSAVVLALPRGGAETGKVIADSLHVPLGLVLVRKIGHPDSPEFAVGAVAEDQPPVYDQQALRILDPFWRKQAETAARHLIEQRRQQYYGNDFVPPDATGKTVIIVDDGIATSLTMQAAIGAVKAQKPAKIIVAVAVAPVEAVETLQPLVDDVLLLDDPARFKGAVGAHYQLFDSVSDEQVASLLREARSNLNKVMVGRSLNPTGSRQLDPAALNINLGSREEPELFKWFLACLLFGKPIRQSIAHRAYDTIIKAGIISIASLAGTDWHELVRLLDRAHYVRYDFSTATKLLDISTRLKRQYGSVSGLIGASLNTDELERRLLAFRGIGPVTASIFIQGLVSAGEPEGLKKV